MCDVTFLIKRKKLPESFKKITISIYVMLLSCHIMEFNFLIKKWFTIIFNIKEITNSTYMYLL